MNPPKLEICFEGYNTDQTDFYIGQLIEKINSLNAENDSAKDRIISLEAENKQLRNELLILVKQLRCGEIAENECNSSTEEIKIQETETLYNESKNEVNTAIRENLKLLQHELNSVKEFIKNN